MSIFFNTVFGINFGFQFFDAKEASSIMKEEAKGGMILSFFCIHIFFIRY